MLRTVALFISILTPGVCGAASPSHPVTVLVFPFENQTKVPALAWLGEGLALSIGDELRIPGIAVIDRSQRVRLVESADLPADVPLSRASMIGIGQAASAGMVVMGSYSGNAASLRISLQIFDPRLKKLGREISAGGPEAGLAEMENELAWEILSDTGLNGSYTREKFSERKRKVPDPAYSYFIRGLVAKDAGDQVKLLGKAVSLYRNFPEAQFQLGLQYYEQGLCARATPHLELGRRGDENYLRGDFMLGTCYLQTNSLSEAIRSYSRLLSFGRPFEALNNLGVAYLKSGDYVLANRELSEARRLARTDLTVALNLALVFHLQGSDSAARAVLEETILAHSDSGMAQFLMSVLLSSSAASEAAASALAKARRLGVDVEKLHSDDPKSWSRLFTSLEHRPSP